MRSTADVIIDEAMREYDKTHPLQEHKSLVAYMRSRILYALRVLAARYDLLAARCAQLEHASTAANGSSRGEE